MKKSIERTYRTWVVLLIICKINVLVFADGPQPPVYKVVDQKEVKSIYKPMECPTKVNYTDQLCTCPKPYTHSTNHSDEEHIDSCVEKIDALSNQIYSFITDISKNWDTKSECRKPEEAFKQSTLRADHTRLLHKFHNKLQSCGKETKSGKVVVDTVSIAVFGGSVTFGQDCNYRNLKMPQATGFLNLDTKLNVDFGEDACPWSNRLYTHLRERYPSCPHIDIYNFARGSSTQKIALKLMSEEFTKPAARGDKKLMDIVDLVLVEYAVNDAIMYETPSTTIQGLHDTESNFMGILEGTTETFINYVMKHIPSKPALLYVETGSPESDSTSLPSHLDACERYGIPIVSVRHALSYPDNPCWLTFYSKLPTWFKSNMENPVKTDKIWTPATTMHDGNLYVAAKKFSNGAFFDDSVKQDYHYEKMDRFMRFPLKEGKSLYEGDKPFSGDNVTDAALYAKRIPREHSYVQCWGPGHHPPYHGHAFIAQVVFYNLQLMAESTDIITSSCDAKVSAQNDGIRIKVNKKLSSDKVFASGLSREEMNTLNPFASCKNGATTEYDAEDIFESKGPNFNLNTIGDNNGSNWKLVEDRPHKFGFVIESSSAELSESEAANTIRFNVILGETPSISLEYMHSYENSGVIEVSLEQPKHQPRRNKPAVNPLLPKLFPTNVHDKAFYLDSYVPNIRHSLYQELELIPSPQDFIPGEAVLVIKRLKMSKEEMDNRGGNRFKIVAVGSC